MTDFLITLYPWTKALHIMGALHCHHKIAPAGSRGPICRIDTRRPAKGVNLDTGIIGQGRQTGGSGGGVGLDPGIADKGGFRLFRFGQIHFTGADY